MFKDNLKKARKHCNLTQNDLGDLLGLSHGTMVAYEQGTREPNLQNLKKMSQILKVSVDDLISDKELSFDDSSPVPVLPDNPIFSFTVSQFELLNTYLKMSDSEREDFVEDLKSRLSQR